MRLRQSLQAPFAFPGQLHQNPPAIGVVDNAGQQFEPCHAIDQLHGGVMPYEQKVSEIAYRDGCGI
jgi:hypothetical protein